MLTGRLSEGALGTLSDRSISYRSFQRHLRSVSPHLVPYLGKSVKHRIRDAHSPSAYVPISSTRPSERYWTYRVIWVGHRRFCLLQKLRWNSHVCSRVTAASWRGPDRATPVNVSMIDSVLRSYMTLFDRDKRPLVRNTMGSLGGLGVDRRVALGSPVRTLCASVP